MMSWASLILFAIVLFIPVIWVIGTYNGLVRLRSHMRESWSGIDTELKRRYDLIPNLVSVVKGYAKHEREVFERVTEARAKAVSSNGSPEHQARDENLLIESLKRLLVVAEAYPELKAGEQYLNLQNELVITEDRIQAARRFYNANVRDLNIRIEIFPANIVANMFKFELGEYFQIDDAIQRQAPVVNVNA